MARRVPRWARNRDTELSPFEAPTTKSLPTSSTQPWIRSWLREEAFWKDVTTRTLSGAVVVLLAYLAGMALGYLHTPYALDNLANGLAIAILVMSPMTAVLLVLVLRRLHSIRGWKLALVVAAVLIMMALVDISVVGDVQRDLDSRG